MPPPLSWDDSATRYWLLALSLPILPWAKPFLPLVELPDFLFTHPEAWEPIYHQAVTEYEILNTTHDFPPGRRGEPVKQVVTKALQQLAAKAGRDVALDLEHWVIRHFYCRELINALSSWRKYLLLASPSTFHIYKIPPPDVLLPILPEIDDITSPMRDMNLIVQIHQVAPPPPYKQSDYERLASCFEATMLNQAANQGLIIKALRVIASKLNKDQSFEVVKWAQLQALALKPPRDPEEICGDKYLQIELPCSDFPSVLDFPSPSIT